MTLFCALDSCLETYWIGLVLTTWPHRKPGIHTVLSNRMTVGPYRIA